MVLLSLKAGLGAVEIARLTWGCIREADTVVASLGQWRSTRSCDKPPRLTDWNAGTVAIAISSSPRAMRSLENH